MYPYFIDHKTKRGRFQIYACFLGLEKFEVFSVVKKNVYMSGTFSTTTLYPSVFSEFLQ